MQDKHMHKLASTSATCAVQLQRCHLDERTDALKVGALSKQFDAISAISQSLSTMYQSVLRQIR